MLLRYAGVMSCGGATTIVLCGNCGYVWLDATAPAAPRPTAVWATSGPLTEADAIYGYINFDLTPLMDDTVTALRIVT